MSARTKKKNQKTINIFICQIGNTWHCFSSILSTVNIIQRSEHVKHGTFFLYIVNSNIFRNILEFRKNQFKVHTMAKVDIQHSTEIKLIISIEKIKDLKQNHSFEIDTFFLRGQMWTIAYEKTIKKLTNETSEDIMAININLKNEDASNDWATVAIFSVKIINPKSCKKSQKVQHGPVLFDAKALSSNKAIIVWKDLIDPKNGFIDSDGACKLKIKIKSSPALNLVANNPVKFETSQQCCGDSTYGKFRMTVNNLYELFGVTSPQFHVNKMPWRILVVKGKDLRVLLWNMSAEADNGWPCQSKIKCNLMALDETTAPITKETDTTSVSALPLEIFNIAWNFLVDTGELFFQNGSFVLEIEIKINHPGDETKHNEPHVEKPEVICTECSHFMCTGCAHSMIGGDIFSGDCGHIFCSQCFDVDPDSETIYCQKCECDIFVHEFRKIRLL